MIITIADQVRGLRLILAAVNADIDAANAVFAEAGAEPDGYVKLAMTSAQASAAALSRAAGADATRNTLLNDIEVLLDKAGDSDA